MNRIEVLPRLERSDVLDVFALVDAASRADGVTPLSEHVLLHLRHGGDSDVRHVIARDDNDQLVGYAHLDATDVVEGPSGELVVRPDARAQGIGSELVRTLVAASGDRLRLWSHGHSDAAEAMSHDMGFERSRVLWQMRRSLLAPLPDAVLPPGYRVRAFAPGIDNDEWLAANAAAFADLPDQGGWNSADLTRRLGEPWFDPQGFFVAVDSDDRIAGFHWTKVHGGEHQHSHDGGEPHSHSHGHEPLGEVYVIGVRPEHRGTGLGRALLLQGLHDLRRRGLPQAMLYVDAANEAAIALYSSLGFTHWDTDVLYRREPGNATGCSALG